MLVSPFATSFFDIYSLSMSSLGCKALFMVISFLVLWLICLSSSLVHFKNGLEYLTRGTAQVFIPLIRFLLHSFVSSTFLVLLRYSFFNFFFHHLFDGVSFQDAQEFVGFLFSVCSILLLIWLFPSVRQVSFSHFSLLAWHIFPCQIDCIFVLHVLEFSVLIHFCKQFDVVYVH